MAVQIPFPLPSHGYSQNSKMRVNLDFLVDTFNQFNTGTATWDTVGVGIANNETGTITFYNSANVNYLTLQAGATNPSITYTLPTATLSSTGVLISTNLGVMSWTRDISVDTVTATGAGSFGSIGGLSSLGLKNGATFITTLKPNASTGTDFDFYFPTTAGSNGQFLTSDGTKTVWADSPVSTGLSGYLAMYGTVSTNSDNVQDHWTVNGHMVRIAIAGHGALAADRTYTIPDSGANTSFLMAGGDISTTGNISNVGDSTKAISSYKFKISGNPGSGILSLTFAGGSSYTAIMPGTQGSANTFLKNDGSGNLSWGTISTSGLATIALDNLSSVAINTSLIGAGDGTIDSGSDAKQWGTVYSNNLNLGKSGVGGTLLVYASTASKGRISLLASDSAGDYTCEITNASLANSRICTIPDAGANASFVMTEGTQTINGAKTFGSGITTGAVLLPITCRARASDGLGGILFTNSTGASQQGAVGNWDANDTVSIQGVTSTVAKFNDSALTFLAPATFSGAVGIAGAPSGTFALNVNSIAVVDGIQINAQVPIIYFNDLNGGDNGSILLNDGIMTFNKGNNAGTLATFNYTANTATFSGTVSQTAQPSFLVGSETVTNVTGDSTYYTVTWPTEIYDQGANFASNTFTAPVTGKYLLTTIVALHNTSAATGVQVSIVTSNRSYYLYQTGSFNTSFYTMHLSVIADMDAGDTATVTAYAEGTTKSVGIFGPSVSYTGFSGSLIN